MGNFQEFCAMIWRSLFFLISSIFGAGSAFKTSSQVPFCSQLRSLKVEETTRYSALFDTLKFQNFDVNLNITDGNGKILTVTIQAINGDCFRVRIEEPSSGRYRLPNFILDGEPKLENIDIKDGDNESKEIHIKNNSNIKLLIKKLPFSLELYQNNILQIVFANRLYMKNVDSDQSFSFDVKFPEASFIYGALEHAENLSLKTTIGKEPYRFRNSDNYGFDVDSPMAMYGAVPVVYGTGPKTTSGIFFFNAGEIWLDITKEPSPSAYFMTESGSLDIFLLPGPTLPQTIRQYTQITGKAHLPQLWALGYHQSRYSYGTQEEVVDVIRKMDDSKFPMDCIWLDIDYTDGYRYFTWNPTNFSDPIKMQNIISETNRKLVVIIDPHIKVDDDYAVYKECKNRDLFIKTEQGENFEGNCWPGLSSWLDFLNPKAKEYYANLFSFENFANSSETLAGIWNDMNEPAVFGDENEKTVPFDALHFGGVRHRDVHNIYGFLQTMGTHEGLMARDKGKKRPFVLTRSHFAGSQRYSAIWTGDSKATWDYLRISFPMCLTSNLLGIVFCGADVGGFIGEPSEELLQRWYQSGAWLPFFRGHSEKTTKNREPYLFGSDVQKVIRKAVEGRYQHIPVFYTLFFQHTLNGDPVVRPLSYHYPEEDCFAIDNQILLGKDILVHNVDEEAVKEVSMYFPGEKDQWYQLNELRIYKGGYQKVPVTIASIPVFYRSGSIITRKDIVRPSTTVGLKDPYTIYINLNEDQSAEGFLYIDDFQSFNYQEKQEYLYVKLTWKKGNLTIAEEIKTANGKIFKFSIEKVVVNKINEDDVNTYIQESYDKDSSGVLLREISIDGSTEIIINI